MTKRIFRELAGGGLHSHYQISLKGVINPDCVYTLDAFKELTGLGDAALRKMRQNGLQMFKTSKRKYIRGSQFIAFLESSSGQEEQEC